MHHVATHLHNGEEGVEAVQVGSSRLHRHADDWQGRESRRHSGQMGCAARPGNDHLRSPSPDEVPPRTDKACWTRMHPKQGCVRV